MKQIRNIYIALLLAASFAACKKDNYKNDQGVHIAKVNMTTYEYLKSKPIFDSLTYLIDRAGLKDAVNGNVTFFATTNYGVEAFLAARTRRLITQTGDENIKFTMDSMSVTQLKDSIKIYMIKGQLGREQMNLDGVLYDAEVGPLPNVKFLIKLERRKDFSNYLSYVDYVTYAKIIGSRDDQSANPDLIPQAEKDISYICQTSGIITTTGIIHVMDGRHRFLFNNE